MIAGSGSTRVVARALFGAVIVAAGCYYVSRSDGPDPMSAETAVAMSPQRGDVQDAAVREAEIEQTRKKAPADSAGVAQHDQATETLSAESDGSDEEEWGPLVRAAMTGEDGFDPDAIDPNQPPVTADNINMIPDDEFADQIRQGFVDTQSYESEIYGFDAGMAAPTDDNYTAEPSGEFADQIADHALTEQARLAGIEIEEAAGFELPEVDPDSHPPTETGASGGP